jgi:hypothetical protein
MLSRAVVVFTTCAPYQRHPELGPDAVGRIRLDEFLAAAGLVLAPGASVS